MGNSDIIGLVITSVIGLSLIVMSIFLLIGKASFLIAGYNTMSKEEKSKYDGIALSKFIGEILLPIGILCPGTAVAAIFNISWFPALFIAVTLSLSTFAVIYCNTGNRFRKQMLVVPCSSPANSSLTDR